MSPEEIRRQVAFQLTQELLQHITPELVRALAETCTRLEDRATRQGVLHAFKNISNQAALDELWSVWSETHHPDLENFLVAHDLPAFQPLSLHITSCLKLGQPERISQDSPKIVEALLGSAASADPVVNEGARQALLSLASPEAQDEVCRWVIEHDHPIARQLALQADFAPRNPGQRALYYLLTEQWGRYQALDFDASLLRAVHQAADDPLRARIAALARQAGWAGYTEAVAGGRNTRRLGELNATEWEVILTLLGRNQRWPEAWRLAQAAPPLWSARLMRDLLDGDWQPKNTDESDGFHALARVGKNCLELGPPSEKLPGAAQVLNGHSRLVTDLAFSPTGAWLASASADRCICLWVPENGHLHAWLQGHSGFVVSLAFSPDGEILASGSADRSIRLWRSEKGEFVQALGSHGGEVGSLVFSPDGRILASGDPVTVRMWGSQNGALLRQLPAQEWGVSSLAFSPDGRYLASGHADNALRLWRAPDGEFERVLMERVACWAIDPVKGGPQAETLLVTASSYGQVRLWNLETGEHLSTLEGRADGEHITISLDGRLLAASDRQVLRLWELPGGKPMASFEAHARPITALAFSPDGHILASSGEGRDVRLWSMPVGKLLHEFKAFNEPIRKLVFSPGSNYLACADQERVHLWALHNLGEIFRTPINQMTPRLVENITDLQENEAITEVEQAWLGFVQELIRWRRRFDIEIDQAPRRLMIGDYDIEISG